MIKWVSGSAFPQIMLSANIYLCQDAPLQALTQKILVLATYHTALSEFVEAYSHREFGLTSHALCSGIRAYLNVRRQLNMYYNAS